MTDDKLKLRYIPLSHAKRWDQNPKRHDLEGLVRSIQAHGFGDPPKFDATLGGLVYGNGRTEALERLAAQGVPPPRGILQRKDGEWAVPVIFGVDAESEAAAVAFAIDHNNLTLLGGDLDLTDLSPTPNEHAWANNSLHYWPKAYKPLLIGHLSWANYSAIYCPGSTPWIHRPRPLGCFASLDEGK